MKQRIIPFLLSVLLFVTLVPGSAWAYSQLYVFGDSLSDQASFYTLSGGVAPPPEYSGGGVAGRFTNGKNYVDYLAPMLGLSSTSFLSGGGTNYALGGARTYYNTPLDPSGGLTGSLLWQYGIYNGSHPTADPNALYIVWAGANNLKDIIQHTPPPPSPSPTLTGTAQDVANVVNGLATAGARNILVPNLPDLGIVPLVTGGGPPNQTVQQITMLYNSLLNADLNAVQLSHTGVNLIRFDTFSFVDEVYSDPTKYGFTNVTDAAYSLFVLPGGTTVSNPEDYLSWDGFHPTTAAHQLLAEQMFDAVVPEPSSFLLVGLGIPAGILFYRRSRIHL